MTFRVVALLCLTGFVAAPISAQTPPTGSVLFLQSDPIGALIKLDGRPLGVKTPALLTVLKLGEHQFELLKSGFRVWHRRMILVAGKVITVPVRLEPDMSTLAFPENQQLILGSNKSDTEGKEFRLADGDYRLTSTGNTVQFEPIFPDQTLLTLSVWSVPVVSTISILSTISDLSANTSAGFPFSATTATSWGFVISDVLWAIALNNSKVRFLQSHQLTIDPLPQSHRLAGTLFSTAKDALENGKLEVATNDFAEIVQNYPDSVETPGAWFYLARLHSLSGARNLAKSEYRIVADELQDSSYYDKACKALADLDAADGDFLQAVSRLDKMVFVDPLFSRDEIQKEVEGLQARIKKAVKP